MLNTHEQSIVSRDPGVRGLELLLNPSLLAAALQSQLGLTTAASGTITYLRYKPGVNCVARFELNGRVGYAKAFGRDSKNKIHKALHRHGPTPGHPTSIVLIPDEHVVCRFFPLDAELPALSKLGDDRERQILFERVFKEDDSWKTANFHLLNYKPERRFVARLDHAEGRMATLKLLSTREFSAVRRSRKKLNLPQQLSLPDWIGGSKNLRAMAYEWLPGQTLETCLRQGHPTDAGRAGSAIAHLHLSSQPALGKRKTKSHAEVLYSLVGQLAFLAPDLAPAASLFAERLNDWFAERTELRQPIHGDFYDRQVIVGGREIGVIDFDGAHLGHPFDDLGCFLAHLERRRVQGVIDDEICGQARSALLEGYTTVVSDCDWTELDMHTAYHLFKLLPHAFRDRESEWPEHTVLMLRQCMDLAGL